VSPVVNSVGGRISQDEYVAAFNDEVVARPGMFEPTYRALLENVMNLADTWPTPTATATASWTRRSSSC
jgi:hypothetical protein